ncbi:hypothetical protein [Candidatus Sarmatiella mevalonica]|nr:hypothetical protein [Candidatus Sarmatiella mevalonica]
MMSDPSRNKNHAEQRIYTRGAYTREVPCYLSSKSNRSIVLHQYLSKR